MKKLFKEVKRFWDKNLRPMVEPALRLIVKTKVDKELNRHIDK